MEALGFCWLGSTNRQTWLSVIRTFTIRTGPVLIPSLSLSLDVHHDVCILFIAFVSDPSDRSAELQLFSGSDQSATGDPVAVVFNHPALQQPIESQSSCCVQDPQEKTDSDVSGVTGSVEAVVVLETTQIFTEPVAKDDPANELPGGDPTSLEVIVVSSRARCRIRTFSFTMPVSY